MKKVLLVAIIAAFTFACGTKKKANAEEAEATQNNEVAVAWAGDYEGTLPCASCEGVLTSLTLNNDNSFVLTETYKAETEEKFSSNGTLELKNDSTIALKVDNKEVLYRIKNASVVMLNQDGSEVTGDLAKDYILYKK